MLGRLHGDLHGSETRERLSEILRKVQDGERVVISEEGRDVAEIRSIEKPVSMEDTLRELERAGILRTASEPRASLAEVVQDLEEALGFRGL